MKLCFFWFSRLRNSFIILLILPGYINWLITSNRSIVTYSTINNFLLGRNVLDILFINRLLNTATSIADFDLLSLNIIWNLSNNSVNFFLHRSSLYNNFLIIFTRMLRVFLGRNVSMSLSFLMMSRIINILLS